MFKTYSYTLLTALIADLMAMSVSMHQSWMSPVLPKLKSDDDNPLGTPITIAEEFRIGSVIEIGAMCGPFLFGFIANCLGRKNALLCAAVPQIVSFLIFAFANTITLFYIARVLGGITLGGAYTLLPMYIAEISEDSNRGMLMGTVYIFWILGILLPYIIGPYASILCFNLISALIPAIFFVLFLFLAPETPHYLVSKNKIKEAEQVLAKLRSHTKITDIQASLKKTPLQHLVPCLKAIGISLLLMVAFVLSGRNAVLLYTQVIFTEAVGEISPEVSSIIVCSICFASSFVVPLISDRSGRRILLVISGIGTALSQVGIGTFFYLKSNTEMDVTHISWLPLISLVCFFMFLSVGLAPLAWTMPAELFPAGVKPFATMLVTYTCYVATFFAYWSLQYLDEVLGRGGTFWLFAGFCAAAALFTMVCVPETKNKSFAEIQAILSKC